MQQSNIFPGGIFVGNGNQNNPSISFQNQPSTGLYLSDITVGISAIGVPVVSCSKKETRIKNKLNIEQGALDGSYLMGDSNGNAFWSLPKIQSGVFKWNDIYNTLVSGEINNSVDIKLSFADEPISVVFSQESPFFVANNNFYISNKSRDGFTIYSTLPVLKTITSEEIGNLSCCRLSNGNIGLAYYSKTQDRILYTHSLNKLGTDWSTPSIIDDISAIDIVSMTIVSDHPAIAYIYNNGINDEWRYIRADDANGISWAAPKTLATSSVSVNNLPITLYLRIVSDVPELCYNNDNGEASIIIANDPNGDSWNISMTISDLTNHRISSIGIVQNKLAIVAISNIDNKVSYALSVDNRATNWLNSTIIMKDDNTELIAADSLISACLFITDTLKLIVLDAQNNLYIGTGDPLNNTWGSFEVIDTIVSPNPNLQIFQNNNAYYLIINSETGKKIISPLDKNYDANVISISSIGTHSIIPNTDDNNSSIVFTDGQSIFLLRFYENDYKINWHAHCSS